MDKQDETTLARMLAERHALFDDAETAVRDEDDLPVDRGASGMNLRWAPVLDDEKLDKVMRGRVWGLCKKHPAAYLEAEDIAQRIRLRLTNAKAKYASLSPEDWWKVAMKIIKNELARYAKQLERECRQRHLDVSRDYRDEKDVDGDEVHWRETLDAPREREIFDGDRLKVDIEEVIAKMPAPSRRIIEEYYRNGKGLRTIAEELGRPFSSFQCNEWAKAKAEFRKYFHFSSVRSGRCSVVLPVSE